MKSIWKDVAAAAFMGMILPGLLLNTAVYFQKSAPEPAVQEQEREVALPVLVQQSPGRTQMWDMDTYLVGVVLAEMPASFETEALKAQAVAARTYARKAYVTGGKHKNGSLCRQSGCCQAFITQEEYLARGGTREGVDKVSRAVRATSGQVLTYEGELIEATYFSCSGGTTEDAAAVWGTDYPYLKSVESPGEEEAEFFEETVVFTPEAFRAALDAELKGDPESWFAVTSYTKGGGVSKAVIGGQTYTGTQLRKLLGLRSTAFRMEVTQEGIAVTTRGYGHRVGMSQYGAEAMAVSGSSYDQILGHYYPETELTLLEPEGEKTGLDRE